jgi:formylglycine-generating enzyme required for sulfatase activity
MSRLLPLACVVFLSIAGNASAQKQKIAPPGVIHLKDNLYIDKVPVSNSSYKEFLYSVSTFWSEKVHAAIESLPVYGLNISENEKGVYITGRNGAPAIDSGYIGPDETLYERMQIPDDLIVDYATNLTMEYYSRALIYKNNPVVYVTHEQAAMFCKWRSDMVMLQYAISANNQNQRKHYYSKVTYRLMTEEEWKYAYNQNAQLLLSDFGVRTDPNQKSFANYVPVDSRPKEAAFSIYANNFAELLLEKKSIIGVLWNNNTQDSKNIVTKSYAPASNVGFRCICEVEQ